MVAVPHQFESVVKWAAGVVGIPPAVVAAQINEESGFHGGCSEVSSAGAIGIAQFEPSTWAAEGCAGSPCNDNDAFKCYAKLMYRLVQQNHGSVRDALAAYNAGEGDLSAGYGYADAILSAAGEKPGLQSSGGTGGNPTGPVTTTSASGDCLWSFDYFIGSACLLTRPQARAVVGGIILGSSVLIALPVVALVVIAAIGHTAAGRGVGQAAGGVLQTAGGVASAAGAQGAGARISGAGDTVRSSSRPGGVSSTAGRYARSRRPKPPPRKKGP